MQFGSRPHSCSALDSAESFVHRHFRCCRLVFDSLRERDAATDERSQRAGCTILQPTRVHFHRVRVPRHCGHVTSHQLDILQLDKNTPPHGARFAWGESWNSSLAASCRLALPAATPSRGSPSPVGNPLADCRRPGMQESPRSMLYLQCLDLFGAYVVLFAVRASHLVMELSLDVLERLSQDAVTSLGKQTQFDDVPRDLLAGAPWEVALAKPPRATSHMNCQIGLHLVDFRLSVRLNTTVQISPRDDAPSSDRANTHTVLIRASAHLGLTLTNLASADRTSKSLCRYDGSTALCSLRPS